jgi:hypothetical protein
MSEAENRAFELLAIAEKQQLEIQAELAAIQHNNQRLTAELGHAVRTAADQAAELTAKRIEARAAAAVKGMERIQWTHYAYAGGGLLLVITALLAFFIIWTPSLDEIAQRKALAEQYGLDYGTCGGKTCVRVIRKQCGYGEHKDFCVIDPKK